MPVVDFDPVKNFVKLLRKNFDSVALFFYNSDKEDVVGVMLRPSFLLSKNSDVITGSHLRLKTKNKQLIPNISSLEEDFYVNKFYFIFIFYRFWEIKLLKMLF